MTTAARLKCTSLCNAKQAVDTRPAHFRAHDGEDAAAALAAGVLQGGYRSTVLKRNAKPSALRRVSVFTLGSGGDTDDAVAEAASVALGTALTRCVPRQPIQPPLFAVCWQSIDCGPRRAGTLQCQRLPVSLDLVL